MNLVDSFLGTSAFADHRGELAALATAVCWTVSALAFTEAARRMGSLALNVIRLAMALGLAILFEGFARGEALPLDASAHNWFWLSLSGLVGFTLGDLCLFRSFVLIGPRLTLLVMSLVPVMAAGASWAALGEGLSVWSIVGMMLTVAGVAWVILERKPPGAGPAGCVSTTGVLLAFGAAAGQAGGLVLSKIGMSDGYDAFASTEIRMMAGLAGFVATVFFGRAWPRLATAARSRPGMAYAALGACFGPFLGVSLSLVAIKYMHVAIAATIIAIVPVLVIPVVIVVYGERVSLRAALGAILALEGVAILYC
ncbi:MAG: DMT family transporter [Planctomycetota bacterium]|nr:DMT family transporter [Planctomycetota bacterium]